MKKHLFISGMIIMMAMALTACDNKDSKVNQILQEQMQGDEGKTSQNDVTEANEVDTKAEPTEVAAIAETTEENTTAEPTEEATFTETTSEPQTETVAKEEASKDASDDNIDVDLTKLSSTMVYSEVYNMLVMPENYIGKTVKMSGMFVIYTNQEETQYYPAVIIADATACCSQGLEFVLKGDPKYPEGYPEMESEITVVGTFETYDELGNIYCRLQNATIV